MNDEYSFPSARREFIKGTGTLVALGSLPGYLTANTELLKTTLSGMQQRQALVIYREEEINSLAFADTLSRAGIKAVALSDDPVRQWRNSLSQLMGNKGLPLMGLSNWPDYLMISGLAAEHRKHVILEIQHVSEQPEKKNWSAELALDYLHLPASLDKESVQRHFSETPTTKINPGTRTLFSWLIA